MSLITSFLIAGLGLITIRVISKQSRVLPLLSLIVLATLLALPLIALLPKVHVTLPAMTGVTRVAPPSFLFALYGLGILLLGGQLLRDQLSLWRWSRQAQPCSGEWRLSRHCLAEAQDGLSFRRTVRIRIHPSLASPVAAGLIRPTIYLPAAALSWERETLRAVLLHELAHHVRHDLWTSLAARLACILHWFNPLVWLLRREHLAQCEYACDARVLTTGIEPKSYAHTLCDLASPTSPTATPTPPLAMAMAMATRSELQERIENLLAPRRPLTFLAIAITLMLTLGTALALSTLRPALQQSFPTHTDELTHDINLRLSANPFPGNE